MEFFFNFLRNLLIVIMGNSQGKKPKKGKNEEIGILDQIFHEMAVRSPDDTISKDTFLKFFELPGVLGDRLFEVFDYKKTGVIDFEEFIAGYSMVFKIYQSILQYIIIIYNNI